MIRQRKLPGRPRSGFTLVEILVVLGIIALLISISFGVINSALAASRVRATQATLTKLHGLVQQRVDAFNRGLDRANLTPASNKMARDIQQQVGLGIIPTPLTCQILVRKQLYQYRFPQSFYENPILTTKSYYVAAKHTQTTESAALLYWILTQSEVYGVAPVDQSDFTSSEVRDTDGDGLLEFVDGWGRPLRFYRWPTSLFRAGSSGSPAVAPGAISASPYTLSPIDPQRTYANVLWSGLPAAPATSGGIDPLSRDPDDPTGELRRFVLNSSSPATVLLTLENRFHTPETYHAFLIMSAGQDNNLGIGEPFDFTGSSAPAPDTWNTSTNSYTLASSSPSLGAIPGQGRLASLLSYNPVQSNPISDNLTNRKRN